MPALAAAFPSGVRFACRIRGQEVAIDVYGRHRQLVRSLVLSGAYADWRGSLPPAEVEARLNRALAGLDRPPAEWVDSYLAGFFASSVPPQTVEAARTMMLDVRRAGALAMVTAPAPQPGGEGAGRARPRMAISGRPCLARATLSCSTSQVRGRQPHRSCGPVAP